jgi:hypothetical protein
MCNEDDEMQFLVPAFSSWQTLSESNNELEPLPGRSVFAGARFDGPDSDRRQALPQWPA